MSSGCKLLPKLSSRLSPFPWLVVSSSDWTEHRLGNIPQSDVKTVSSVKLCSVKILHNGSPDPSRGFFKIFFTRLLWLNYKEAIHCSADTRWKS